MATKQRSFKVNGEKITIKSRNKTSVGHPNGFSVWINGVDMGHQGFWERQKAEDVAFKAWVKKYK